MWSIRGYFAERARLAQQTEEAVAFLKPAAERLIDGHPTAMMAQAWGGREVDLAAAHAREMVRGFSREAKGGRKAFLNALLTARDQGMTPMAALESMTVEAADARKGAAAPRVT